MHHDGEFVVELDVHLMAYLKQRGKEGELGSPNLPHVSGRFSSVLLLKGSIFSQKCHGLATKSLTDLLGTLIQTITITCSRPAVPTFPTDLCRPHQQQCEVHPHKGQLIATLEGSWASVICSVPHCWNSGLWLRSHAHCSHGHSMPHSMRSLLPWRGFSLLEYMSDAGTDV